jgi:tetratricopeptide (TPR) repeat protein
MALQREQVVQTAEKYVSRGRIEPAIREYRKLLAENPNDINTLNRVGDLYARIQRIDEAVEFFEQIASQYSSQGFFVKAIAIYKKIIKLDPTRLDVYEKLAELYHRQGLVTEARTQYQVLADYYQKHDNAASAIAIYIKMTDLEPENPSYHVKLAEIYQQQKLIEKALNEYRIIAEMMIRHGRPHEAAQVFERALDLDSKNLRFIQHAVETLREAGDNADAARFLTAAVERNPEAEQIARMMRERPAAPEAPAAAIEVEEPSPAPAPAMAEEEEAVSAGAIGSSLSGAESSIELEIDLGDDLMTAMREAERAVSGDGGAVEASAAAVEDEEEIEIELDLDADSSELLVELPAEEEEPTSQVRPPADLLEAPRRPAWAQDRGTPAVAAGETQPLTLPAEDAFGEIDLDPLPALETEEEALPVAAVWEVEEEPAAVVEATPEPERDELITEAEVLAKYGLEEKALERLDEALRLRPDNLPAHALLIRLHLEKGRHAQVTEMARKMSAFVTPAVRGREPWQATRKRLSEAGYRFDGDRLVAGPMGEVTEIVEPEAPSEIAAVSATAAPPEAAPPEPAPEVAAFVADEVAEVAELSEISEVEDFALPVLDELPAIAEPDLLPTVDLEASLPSPEPAAPPVPPAPAPVPAAPPAKRPAAKPAVDDLLRGLLDSRQAPVRKPAPPARPAAAASATPAPPAPAPPAPPPRPSVAPPPAGAMFDLTSIGEMIEREEVEGIASPALPPAIVPPEPSWESTRPGLSAEPAPPYEETRLEDVSWLDEVEAAPPAAASASAASPASPASAAAGSAGLFSEEDDFFDLAGELVEELSREEVFLQDGTTTIQSEQSLEDIVEGFKKGVAEHLSPTDYDTHYNLGIAYREMGLLDEAIGEFQLASKDPRHLVLCCSMLGLCFLDKGLPELAIKWYRRGLEAPSLNEEDHLGLMYDLGNAYQTMGDVASAYPIFVDIYGINSNYRDVVARLEELGRPR